MIRVSRKRFASLVLGLALVAAGVASAQQDRSRAPVAKGRPVPTNAAGQPVRSADGVTRNHGPEELQSPASSAAASSAAATAPGLPAPAAPGTLARWGFAALGSGIGLSGIVTARNGNRTEIYVGGSTRTFGSNDVWYALRYSPETGGYEQIYVSDHLPQGIRRIALARVGGWASPVRASPRIVVALADGTVRLYDQRSKRLLSSYMDPCSAHGGLQTLITGDLDGNGSDEYISSCADQTLFVYGTGYAAWALPGVGGRDLVVGQMDDDPALEIATTSGYVIDTKTRAVQWHRPEGFGVHLQAADIDGDGRDELIAAEGWYVVWAYDVERQLPKWSIRADLDVGAILVTDLDGDGVRELLIGDGQWGEIHAYDTVTLQEKWAIRNPEHGVTNIAVADVNDDGTTELLWGAGATSTGSDHLYIASWQTRTILWQNEHLDGPFLGPLVGDLDGDGVDEIVVASFSSESGYDSGRIVVIDGRTLTVRAISPGVAGGWMSFTGIHDLKLRDLDGDGRPEILVATDRLYDGLIEAYSFSAANEFTLVWTNATRPSGSPFYSVDVADVDGDGDLEVVAGGGRAHTGAAGVFIYAYDVATRAEQWHTLQVGDYWSAVTDLVIADTDADGAIEVAGMVDRGDVYVFGGAKGTLEAIIDTQGASLTTLDPGPAGAGVRLLLGDTAGRMGIRAFDGVGYPEVAGANLGSAPLDGLNLVDSGALWVGSGGTLQRYRRLLGGRKTFESANYGPGFGRNLGIVAGRRWVFTAGGYGVHGFATSP